MPLLCTKSRRIFFLPGFPVNFRESICEGGLPGRRNSRGLNWRSAGAHEIFPTQTLRRSLSLFRSHFLSFALTFIRCNTVMHTTSSQGTCYLPQCKPATSTMQRQGGTTPLPQVIVITTSSECSQSPASETPCDPTKVPLQNPHPLYMGKMGSICHFPRVLPASIWGHCSQILVFTSNCGTQKRVSQ